MANFTGIAWHSNVYSYMSQRDVIASVIQGESATPAGQFAVASVMSNRLNSGDFGDSIQQVVQPNQFNGFQTPSPQAYALADGVINNNLSQYGNTGNALYFAAPSTGNADWANPNTNPAYFNTATNIGGNYYSNNAGVPTSNFQAPQYGGGAASATGPTFDQSAGANAQQDALQDQQEFGYPGSYGDSYTGGNGAAYAGNTTQQMQSLQIAPMGSLPPGDGTIGYGTHFGVGGSLSPDGVAAAGNTDQNYYAPDPNDGPPLTVTPPAGPSQDANVGTPVVGSGEVGTGSSYTPATETAPSNQDLTSQSDDATSSAAGSMTIPQAIDAQSQTLAAAQTANDKTIANAATTQAKASEQLGKTLTALVGQIVKQTQQSTTQSTSTAQDIKTTGFAFMSNIFVRGALIALGLVFVAIGLSMFKPVQQTIVQPVVSGAKKAAKIAVT